MKIAVKPLLAASLLLLSAARAETPVEQVARRFREYCLHENTDHGARLLDDVEMPKTSPDEATKLAAALRDDGSWPDLDYASAAPSFWPPGTHLTRALALVVTARRADTPEDTRAGCLAAAHRALAYWREHDYRCVNWWYNNIGVPKMLGFTALLLGDDLTADEKMYITQSAMNRAKVGSMTGQNRVWLATNGAMRAALLADETLLRQASDVIQDELRVGHGEGVQPDWSFHQHGPQQQFGNYGLAYALEMSRWATIFRGTPWAFSEQKMAVLRRYLLDGENWMLWRGTLDIGACGRQLFPGSPRAKGKILRGVMRVMLQADPGHSRDYLACVERNQDAAPNELTGNRYFWRSDGMAHRRPDWMATLKMSSNRVVGGETVNNENLSGLYLADGATMFYRDGHEYDDVFPTWDWRMVPGVTSVLDDRPLGWPRTDRSKFSALVGGVSDGANGCAALDFRRDDLRAKKAWFFMGDTVVCLGADVNSTSGQPTVTTINQCLRKTVVVAQRAGHRTEISGTDQNLESVDWVEQDSFRYTRLGAGEWRASAAAQTGTWRKVFDTPSTPKAELTQEIFKLWIAHGGNASGASYAYSVAPTSAVDKIPFKVLLNTGQAQAVKIGAGKAAWVGVVFWGAASVDLDGLAVTADAPCLVMIGDSRTLVSDPTQKLAELRLEIGGYAATVALPQGDGAGSSVELPREPGLKENPPGETPRQ